MSADNGQELTDRINDACNTFILDNGGNVDVNVLVNSLLSVVMGHVEAGHIDAAWLAAGLHRAASRLEGK